MDKFNRLLDDAMNAPFSGWDFSYLAGRWHEQPPPWSYRELVQERLAAAGSLLDMGTGGGEFLSSLSPLPARTCATESYPPNIPVARARLAPLGVEVVAFTDESRLPLESGRFDLVINRHESYDLPELWRILRPGGRFLTQQVGDQDNLRLNELLQGAPAEGAWSADVAAQQLAVAGFQIVRKQEAFPLTTFRDIGAVVYYLRIISWQIPDFTVVDYRERLRELHERMETCGDLASNSHRFLVEAVKPHVWAPDGGE